MDAKELANKNFEENKHFLEGVSSFEERISFGETATLIMTEKTYRRYLKQARNEALEESAKLADDCAGHYSPECECINIAKAIRALKEK